ncbi:hypothetical protein EsDP_00001938 [Epichloe bromicola]|uniref:AAA+ ATPase domain-containing protein n=1 Tax=Epichloe bromicola TaxID=79588 RepID=A0ABQ0CJA8_9HYPO
MLNNRTAQDRSSNGTGMGPVIVNMSHRGVGEPSTQKLHPFFAKGSPSDLATAPPSQHFGLDDVRDPSKGPHHNSPLAKRHKLEHLSSQFTNNAEALTSGQEHTVSAAGWIQPLPDRHVMKQIEQQPTPGPIQHREILAIPEFPTTSHAHSSVKPSETAPGPTSFDAKDTKSTGPSAGRKVLKFNMKTGTLGSPPKAKQKPKPSRMVCVRYGKDDLRRREFGEKITQILNGDLQLPTTPTEPRSTRKKAQANDGPTILASSSKTTHPFFTGKSKPQSSAPSHATDAATAKSPSRKHSIFMSTPVSPRKPKNPFISINQNKAPQFGSKSGGTRVPGAKYPMWPPKGMSHVRGDNFEYLSTAIPQLRPVGDRKSKGQVTTIGQAESVLTAVMEHIDVEALRGSLPRDEDSFTPAPSELRMPQRHFESGLRLQHRIRPQLSISSPISLAGEEDVNQDELAGPAPAAAHPAISRHYVSLVKQLSAFDRSTCERMDWNQKYAPVSAAQVLQKGKDAIYIKHWLEAMKVQSVETGGSDSMGDRNKQKADVLPKKRRKKNKVDDFIFDTEDEASELEQISECGDDEDDDTDSWQAQKSVMRSSHRRSKELGRLKNTIVLSGPNGCGKTAAVYAIAKELGFEVFEINASSRRSGKDVLERIGDMTRNHLVQQHRAQPPCADDDTTDAADLHESKSSKQGVMTAFFKKKPEGKANPKKPKKASAAQAQKQSLILIEEADILYEEDKQLWATLMGMMNQSRRPFVVTCNDESLVPLQSLNLHGIFRFTSAPIPSAVDLCVLIAANEGHALRRGAVEALYQSRKFDLRATISDLNFWCQIGVGDRKGGFDWFYSRWPKGCDLDERGDVVRVISQDTYRHGMGWIGRDAILSERNRLDREMEVLQQSWSFWQVDTGDWCQSAEMSVLANDVWCAARKQSGKRATALEAFDDFYQTQSDADLFSSGIFAKPLKERVDPTLPEMATGVRDDFIIGRNLLDAQEVSYHTTYSQSISLALRCQARHQLCLESQRLLQPLDKPRLRSMDESAAIAELDASFGYQVQDTTRMDIAYAFDPIAVAPKAQPTSHLDPTVFDRTMRLIVVDVAPWVRGIVAFENQLMQQRQKLNSLLGEGATRKRMRNTRSAYSALEGGERRSTRKERYFGDSLTTSLVLRTGSPCWRDAVAESMQCSRMETDGGG